MDKSVRCIQFIVLFVSASIALAESYSDSTENTLNFVNALHGQLKLTDNPDVILVLGITGVGKSALVHCISTDCSRLLSIDKDVEYVVIDELDVGYGNITSTSVSRTLVPEAIVDSTQNIWYDCPGFGDTRNETVEIATTYLIKRVIENAKRVKVVLVVDFDSITRGHNRDGFDRLLSRTTQLIKNPEKFERSYSLVITKVPSYKGRHEIQDDNVKKSAADFMLEHRTSLQEKLSSELKIAVIDALLGQQTTSYSRISIFWRPGEEGYFNRIPKLVVGRQRIRESIMEHSSFTEIHKNDFGFPLTAEAVIKVTHMTTETVNSFLGILQSLNQRIPGELRHKISTTESFQDKLELIKIGKRIIQSEFKMNAHNEVITLKKLVMALNRLRLELHLNSIDKRELDRIEQHENNLKMLQSLVEIENVSFDNDLNRCLEDIIDFFNNFENQIQTDITSEARQKIADVSTSLAAVDRQLLDALKEKIRTVHDYHDKLVLLEIARKQLASSDTARTSMSGKIQEYRNLFADLNITNHATSNSLNQIERHEKYLNELKVIARTDINLPIRDWMALTSSINSFIPTEFNWYSLLQKVYEYLAQYVVQRDTAAYNVADLDDWGQPNKRQGLTIDQMKFGKFVGLFTVGSEFKATASKLAELNQIVDTTLKTPPKYECGSGGVMTIKGNFIKITDIQLSGCGKLQKIIVMAADTFFVDGNLHLTEYADIELHIFSTTFSVQQTATFDLSGRHGEYQSNPSSKGTAGRPGKLGMNSGNFFALANEIHMGERLTVQQIAGDGANGQGGSGNDDYNVSFNNDGDSKTAAGIWKADDVREYQRDLVYGRSRGEGEIIKQTSEAYLNHYAVVTAGRRVISDFLVTAKQCCGSTGIGGPGKLTLMRMIYTVLTQTFLFQIPKKVALVD